MLLDDRALRLVRWDVRDRLVLVRIEGQTERLHRPQALGLEDPPQLSLKKPHSLDPRRALELVRDSRLRAIESVELVGNIRDGVRARVLGALGPLLLDVFAVVIVLTG